MISNPLLAASVVGVASPVFCCSGGVVNVARLGGYYRLKYYRSCELLIANTPGVVRYLVEDGWPVPHTGGPAFTESGTSAMPGTVLANSVICV